MSDYWRRLKSHPGFPIAAVITVAMTLAGAANPHQNIWWMGIISSTGFWIPVLLTARTQPLPMDESDE